MSDQQVLPNLETTNALLTDLLRDVQTWEGTLAGGQKLGVGATAVESLFQTKVRFGDPRDRLIPLTETTFQTSGVELTDLYRQQMQTQYDFYYLALQVGLIPKPGALFRRFTCQLDFNPLADSPAPIIQSLFPSQQWRSVFTVGVGMDLGLNGDLEWAAGIDPAVLGRVKDLLPIDLRANIANKNEFKAFITVPAYQYELGQSEITAVGAGNSLCYWRIQDANLQKMGTIQLCIVFKVPKQTKTLNLRGIVWAEPDMNWLTANVRDVFRELSDRLQALLKRKDESAIDFARGDAEEWTLQLPGA